MSKVIGIDLGTTNSCVAVLEGGEPTVITNAEGMRTTPSVVSFTKSGERLVGETAKRIAITEPEGTVASIKRHMGENYTVNLRGRDYTPQEISAMILQKLKADAEAYLGEKVTEAVITVPAYFIRWHTDSTRTQEATRSWFMTWAAAHSMYPYSSSVTEYSKYSLQTATHISAEMTSTTH